MELRPGTARTWPSAGGTEDLRPEQIRTPGLEPQSTSSICEEEVWGGLSLRSVLAREGTRKLSGHHLAWLLSIRAVPSLDWLQAEAAQAGACLARIGVSWGLSAVGGAPRKLRVP